MLARGSGGKWDPARMRTTNLMQIQPVGGDCVASSAEVVHFFAKRQGTGEKGVDASGADPHNSPAQLNRLLFDGEKCWLCSSVG